MPRGRGKCITTHSTKTAYIKERERETLLTEQRRQRGRVCQDHDGQTASIGREVRDKEERMNDEIYIGEHGRGGDAWHGQAKSILAHRRDTAKWMRVVLVPLFFFPAGFLLSLYCFSFCSLPRIWYVLVCFFSCVVFFSCISLYQLLEYPATNGLRFSFGFPLYLHTYPHLSTGPLPFSAVFLLLLFVLFFLACIFRMLLGWPPWAFEKGKTS